MTAVLDYPFVIRPRTMSVAEDDGERPWFERATLWYQPSVVGREAEVLGWAKLGFLAQLVQTAEVDAGGAKHTVGHAAARARAFLSAAELPVGERFFDRHWEIEPLELVSRRFVPENMATETLAAVCPSEQKRASWEGLVREHPEELRRLRDTFVWLLVEVCKRFEQARCSIHGGGARDAALDSVLGLVRESSIEVVNDASLHLRMSIEQSLPSVRWRLRNPFAMKRRHRLGRAWAAPSLSGPPTAWIEEVERTTTRLGMDSTIGDGD